MNHLRRTWNYALVSADEEAFDAAVRDYLRAARGSGMPVERVIIAVKRELRVLTASGGEAPRALSLLQRAVQIVITEYYESA